MGMIPYGNMANKKAPWNWKLISTWMVTIDLICSIISTPAVSILVYLNTKKLLEDGLSMGFALGILIPTQIGIATFGTLVGKVCLKLLKAIKAEDGEASYSWFNYRNNITTGGVLVMAFLCLSVLIPSPLSSMIKSVQICLCIYAILPLYFVISIMTCIASGLAVSYFLKDLEIQKVKRMQTLKV